MSDGSCSARTDPRDFPAKEPSKFVNAQLSDGVVLDSTILQTGHPATSPYHQREMVSAAGNLLLKAIRCDRFGYNPKHSVEDG
jgi:hypothetical protein